MNNPILPEWFLDWWFAPWQYAGAAARMYAGAAARMAHADDVIALRDGYRLWCEQAHVAADLPASFDKEWHIACTTNGDELVRTARLFAGLFAARAHEQEALNELSLADRKWCAGIASIQPVRAMVTYPAKEPGSIDVSGLAELAMRLEQAFPGMWSRLRLMLPPSGAGKVDAILGQMPSAAPDNAASVTRIRRCWQMCRQRASASRHAGAV
jgi:hypothetical protein